MKKYLYTILLLLFSTTFFSANAQFEADTIAECFIRANKMDVIGDSLFIDWEIHINGFEIGSHNSLSLTPVLQNGKDSLELPSIIINGINKQHMYKRALVFSPKKLAQQKAFVVRCNNPYQIILIPYKTSVIYNKWMRGTNLNIIRRIHSYSGKVISAEKKVLANNVIINNE